MTAIWNCWRRALRRLTEGFVCLARTEAAKSILWRWKSSPETPLGCFSGSGICDADLACAGCFGSAQEPLCALGTREELLEAEVSCSLCPELAFCIEAERRGREHICLGCKGRVLIERDVDGCKRKMPRCLFAFVKPGINLLMQRSARCAGLCPELKKRQGRAGDDILQLLSWRKLSQVHPELRAGRRCGP